METQTFRYRLYTEYKNINQIRRLFDDIQGYTMYDAHGIWKGESEPAVIFEVVSDKLSTLSVFQSIARIIRQENGQEAVLVTREPIEAFTF